MKKNYFLVLASLLLLIAAFNQSFAGDRMVLVERFTSSTCGPCAANNPTMDAFLSSVDADKITGISYHMNWPGAGNDPMYLHNPGDNTARRNYYGINSIPEARMDGLINVLPAYNQSTLQSYFNSRTNILSPITLIVTNSIVGDTLKIKAIVYCETNLTNPNVFLHIAVVEKYKQYSSPPGTNGETVFRDIMRKLSPDGNGTPLTLFPGQVVVINKSIYMHPEWQPSQIKALAFVQDNSNKEILNSAVEPANFSILPSPGYKVVQQGQSQSATFKVKLPFVAPGYNSPITFTAAPEPSVNGITVTFPNGNVLSNYTDSITMQVSSTSAVATGEYRILITGTNTNNKVHKTSVSYLVGKNYVSVSCSRPSLQFKVDNVTYTNTKNFTWDVNSVHTLAAVSPQLFGSTRYVFHSWSQGGDSVQNRTIGVEASNFVVNYKLQNKLITMNSPAVNVEIIGGNVFYDSGSTASISLSALQVQYNGMTYYFQRWQGTGNGSYTGTNPNPQIVMNNVLVETAIWDTIAPIGIGNISSEVPSVYSLFQNYPNPFNPVTSIKYGLPKDGEVKLAVYDILGNEVAVIYNGYRKAGYYEDIFDANNIASGIYFYRINAGQFTDIKKMVLIK